jgi:hypothetical protein
MTSHTYIHDILHDNGQLYTFTNDKAVGAAPPPAAGAAAAATAVAVAA